ncbi:LytTR family DNA-binding domain-containing protein [Ferrimonas pelagia]|uniref:HTH LytTR-type domain-containing protein n=1 Tax=Ferrimonas pelagia TaxID=1177826 RepID=A0ABP9EJF8_9GAMM
MANQSVLEKQSGAAELSDFKGAYALMVELSSVLANHETSEQLLQLTRAFHRVWPLHELVWFWRGKPLSQRQRLDEIGKISCSNILSGRIYGPSLVVHSELQDMYRWIACSADMVIAANRGRISKTDFRALADIRELIDDCVYVKAANQYVELFNTEGRCFLFRVNLHQVESLFAPEVLCRVHRSYLVNPEHVMSTKKQRNGRLRLLLQDLEIPVGECYSDELKLAQPDWFSKQDCSTPLQQWLYSGVENTVS